jgi:hypothetical protein
MTDSRLAAPPSDSAVPGQSGRGPAPAADGLVGAFNRGIERLLPGSLAAGDRPFYRDLLILGVALFAASTITYLLTMSWRAPIPRDSSTLAMGRDFLNFWMYGRAAWLPDPSRFYDPALYNADLFAMLGNDYPRQNWSYPPSNMLIAAPFGLLGYLVALACWTAIGLALFAFVVRRRLPDPKMLVPILLSPAAFFCLISGQSSFITTAMLLTIFAFLDRRPIIAGILIGLLTIKPQLGLLFPFMLIASGRWRVFMAAAVTTLGLVAVTAALFGPQIWIDFVTKGVPVQNFVLADPELVATPFYPTIFMNVRGLDLSYATAMSVQAVFSLGALGAVVWAFRMRTKADPLVLMALFFACSVSASPYMLAYDTLPMTCAAVALLGAGKLDGAGRRVAQLAFWLPGLQLALGMFHIPGPALVAPAFAMYLVLRLRGDPAPCTAPA